MKNGVKRVVTRFSSQAKHEKKHWWSTTDSFCVVMLQILTGGLCWFVALISCFTHLNTESAASLVTLLLSIIEELAVRHELKWEAGLWKCLISFPIISTNRGQQRSRITKWLSEHGVISESVLEGAGRSAVLLIMTKRRTSLSACVRRRSGLQMHGRVYRSRSRRWDRCTLLNSCSKGVMPRI